MMGYETENVCRIEVEHGKTIVLSFEPGPREPREIIVGPSDIHPLCAVHGVDIEDFIMIQLPVIDTAMFCDEAYEKTRLEKFHHGNPLIVDGCLIQSTDSAFAHRCPECLEQARIWLGR